MRPTLALAMASTRARAVATNQRPTVRAPKPDSAVRLRPVCTPAEATPGADGPDAEPEVSADRDPRAVEVELRLVTALRSRDVETTLFHASVLAYVEPGNDVARRIKERCVVRMKREETASFPDPRAVPRRTVEWSALEGRDLPRATLYLLSLVDGAASVEAIVDASAMPVIAAYDALEVLLAESIVAL